MIYVCVAVVEVHTRGNGIGPDSGVVTTYIHVSENVLVTYLVRFKMPEKKTGAAKIFFRL